GIVLRDTQHVIDVRSRFEAAMRSLGRWLSPIVVHVVLTDEPATAWAGLNGRLWVGLGISTAPASFSVAAIRAVLVILRHAHRQ
ncbi:MAG: hypothetical protein AAF637_17505, partial [Pseudomonadota bacterium]